MKEFKLTTVDNKILSVFLWDDVKKPIGAIQLVHGSAEHSRRYDDFANKMNKKGFIVIADDHRGHGYTALDNDMPLGYFSKHNGWRKIIDDELIINSYINKHYSDLPIFMLGHSMGSFIARDYAIKYSETIDGLIISGNAEYSDIELKSGKFVANIIKTFTGGKKPSKLLWNLSYHSFNKKFKGPEANGSEWQTRDVDVQRDFVNDKLAGQVFTSTGFRDMFVGLGFIKKKKNIKLMRTDLPILLISGLDDPVGKYGKSVQKIYDKFTKLGYKVKMKLYPNLRHEILFEPEKKEVENDIVNFIEENIID